jgi:hypothetical protein
MIPPAAIHRRLVVLMLALVATLAFPAVAGAMVDTDVTAPASPTVWTDKADYNPGAAVTLSGAGWAPGEAVHVVVDDSDGQTWSYTDGVTASNLGELTDQFTLPTWFVANYTVTATGNSGETATTSFTDGNLNFKQATADTTQPTAAWSVDWLRYSDSSCTVVKQSGSGTATYIGSALSSGSEPGVGNNQSAQPAGVTAPTGFAFTYWSDSATSTTPVTGTGLCRQGPNPPALYAHFRPTIISTSTTVTTSGSPSTYGGQVAFTATVTPASGPAATGTVAFTDGATALCNAAALSGSGQATCQTSSLSAAASPHTITATYSGSATLSPSSGAVQQAVGKATLTVTASDPGKTYGDANPALSAGLAGFVNGDTSSVVSGTASCSSPATGLSGAGTYPITCTQGTLSAANYTFAFVNGTLTVGRRPLTVTAQSQSRPYGDANPGLTATVGGFVNGDTATTAVAGSAACTTTATATSGVGSYPVTCSAGTLASANYSFGTFVAGSLTVTKAPLTVRADDQTRTYGDPNPALTGTITGTKNGDDLVDSYTTDADKTSGVGGYAIAAHIAAGPGADLANYDIKLVDGTLTVTKAPLTVKADDQTRTYGDPNPALTGTVTGAKNGDELIDTYTTGTDSTSGVGTYAINAHVAAGPEADLGNYDVKLVDGTLSVTKAPLTVKADDQTRTYGDPNPTFTGTITGTKNGDDLVDSYTTGADKTSSVGNYPITADIAGAALANYDIKLVDGTLTVTKAPLTLKADDQTRTYGDANPALTGTVTGTKNGDHLVDSYSTDAQQASGVGDYTITAHIAAGPGADLGNYDVKLVDGTLSVTQAPLTVKADDQTRTYGDPNPALTGTVTGTKNGDDLVDSYTTGADKTTSVGTYAINAHVAAGPGVDLANYDIKLVDGTLTVTQAPLTVKADDQTRTYGDPNPTLTGTVTGTKNGDHLVDSYSTDAQQARGVGDYTITAHIAAGPGADLGNYDVKLVDGTLSVTQAPLTVKADDQTRIYGDPNPTFTGTITGTKNGDDLVDSYSTDAQETSGVGDYAIAAHIAAGPGADLGNYDVKLVDGTLTVTKAPLTVKANDSTKTYGDPNPTVTGTITGAKNGDALIDSYTTGADKTSSVGTYAINAHVAAGPGADLANYDVKLVDGTLTVTKAPLTVKADDQTRTYGDPNPTFTGTITGAKNSDSLVDSYTTGADKTSGVGNYPLAAHIAAGPGADLANYSVTLVNGSLTVTRAPLTITADDKAKTLNAVNPALTGSIAGLKNGDAITAAYTTSATAGSPVGTYTIVPAAVDSSPSRLGNYNVTLVNGTLTVTYATGTCAGSAGRTVLQPLNADGSSVFKKGSTVPVKFRVCDANGVSIGSVGVVTGSVAAPVLLSKSTGAGGVDESVYSTTPDTSFRWDPSAQQWIYNQATSNLTSGVVYTYKIPLNDGTWITYRFSIR